MTATAARAERPPRATELDRRIPALDGLRGLAVVVVVLYHAGHLRGGFLGVDLFFVLSGFLITTILLRNHRPRDPNLRAFWARRARRLFPALLAMLAVVVPVYAAFFASPTELTVLRREAVATLFYVANWQQILSGQTYWAATLDASPLRHTWSLAVEEQFYLVWPLLAMAVLRRRGVGGLRTVAVVGAIGAVALTVVLAHTGTVSFNALYLSTITRSGALLAGAALAAWRWQGRRAQPEAPTARPALEWGALAAAAVLGFMVVTVGVSEARLYEWGLAVSTVCGVVLVAAAASPQPGPVVRALHFAPLRYLGTISYAIYLWSWPIMQVVDERHTDLSGWPLLVAQLAFTLAVSQASWMFLESPILRGALGPPRGLQALVGATLVVLIIIVVSTLGARPTDPLGVDTSGYASTSTAQATKLLVVGDSVPGVLAREGIRPLGDELGVSVVNRALPGCILLRAAGEVKGTEGNIRDDVGPCNQDWRAQVAELDPDVVLVMFGQFANDQVRLDGDFRRPCDATYQAELRRLLTTGLDDLTSGGATAVIATAPWSSVDWVTDSGPVLAERMTCLNDLYRAIASERDDVEVVDLASYICPAPDRCVDEIDGVDLREDTVHFRGDAAEIVARWLVPQVVGAAPPPTNEAKDPYCAQLAALVPTQLTGPGADVATIIAALRDIDPVPLAAAAPETIRADMELLAANWQDYLDALATVPAAPTIEQVQAAIGDYGAPVTRIVGWATDNC